MKTKETKGERRRRDGILLPGDGHEEYRAVVGASIHQVFHHFHYSPPAPLARPVMLTLPAAIWHSGKFPSLKGRYIFHPRRNFAVFAATGRLIKRGREGGREGTEETVPRLSIVRYMEDSRSATFKDAFGMMPG